MQLSARVPSNRGNASAVVATDVAERDWFLGDSAVALRSLAGGSQECLPLPPRRRVAIVLTRRMTGPGVEKSRNDSKKVKYGQSSLCKIRNESNFRTRHRKTAQIAVKRAWHEAGHANVNQRDDPTWISSFSRVAASIPDSLEQRKNKPDCSVHACEILLC